MTSPRLPPRALRDEGYLLEANRLFFHPLGLALTTSIDRDDGEPDEVFVQDWRAVDDEGGFFGNLDDDDDAHRKHGAVRDAAAKFALRRQVMREQWGCDPAEFEYLVVQPIGSKAHDGPNY